MYVYAFHCFGYDYVVRFNHYAQGMDGKAVLDLVMLYLNAVHRFFIENYVFRSLTFYDFSAC